MSLDKHIIDSQENEYWFPYHYVTKMPAEGFRQHFVDTWGINYISTIEFILERIRKLNPNSLIDIGCGDGRLTREIALSTDVPILYGVDYSKRAISLATAMNQDISRIIYTAEDIMSVHELPKVDVIILMEVFEHIPIESCEQFLKSASQLLNKGGKLLLTVPHSNKPVEYKHFQHFSISSLTSSLENYFDIVDVVPFERKGIIRKWMNYLLANRFFILNNGRLLKYVYQFNKKFLFRCGSESCCQRLFVEATVK
jgi:cyclopropane fatty-acyl-phospholipid synthase-like methyltransferase